MCPRTTRCPVVFAVVVIVCAATAVGLRADPPDPLDVPTLDVAAAKAVVARQAAQPSVAAAEPWSNHWKHAVLRRAGFTATDVTRLAVAIEQASRRAQRPVPYEEFLTRTRDRTWRRLANRIADCLHLPAVATLDPDVARILAGHHGGLSLSGLTALDVAGAGGLAAARGRLDLGGLRGLDADVAAALATHRGPLHLDGLVALTTEAAEALSAYRGPWLDVSGLGRIEAGTARGLAACPGWDGRLDRVENLAPAAARELAVVDRVLGLRGLKTLSAETAEPLAGGVCGLDLSGLTAIDADVAARLAACSGPLHVAGLTAVTPPVARALVGCTGWDGQLPNVKTLSAEVAEILAARRGNSLVLSGLTAIDVPTARLLAAGASGGITLSGLESLPLDVATVLASRTGGRSLGVRVTGDLDPKVAAALARASGNLTISGLERLTPAAAAVFTGHTGILHFPDLVRLDPPTVAALSEKPFVIALPALATLDVPTARALAQCRARVLLERPQPAAPEVIDILVACEGRIRFDLALVDTLSIERAVNFTSWVGGVELPGIEALDAPDAVAIAEALIAHAQPVALPMLRRITEPALETLERKPDIRLPARDTMHIVPADVRKR